MIFLVMGVCGVGKSLIGKELSLALGAKFIEADDLHSDECKSKMQRGQPLTDDDRQGWLERLVAALEIGKKEGCPIVLACSALKQTYRDRLLRASPEHLVIWLHAPREIIAERLESRRGHFMNPSLLDNQLAILEPPLEALIVRADQAPSQVVTEILKLSS
jgi:gluconokinase